MEDTLLNIASGLPSRLSPEDVPKLVEHGIAPLLYSLARTPELRGEAIRAAALESLRAEDVREVLAMLAAHG
ncbi:MAG TPA: hypothetical protein VJZ00_16300, partial [Thermoanaerobaculia bacterium]|nr:hypothetical protein [Thermoanaerobaculia bacterium]